MRGSAQRSPFGAAYAARRAAWQGVPPVHPDQEKLLLHGPLASEGTPSDTSSRPSPSILAGLGLRIPRTCASRAASRRPESLAPLDPSAEEEASPLPPHPRMRMRACA